MRRRKLMLPPFHGDRMRAYEALIAEVTAAELAGWPPARRSRSTRACSRSRSR